MNALIGIAGHLGCFNECTDTDTCDAQGYGNERKRSAHFRVRQIAVKKHAPGFEAYAHDAVEQ